MCYACEETTDMGMSLEGNKLVLNCPFVIKLRSITMMGVDTMVIRDCFCLKTIENVPEGIIELKIIDCPNLETLPVLPNSLLAISVSRSSVVSLPILPVFLIDLFLDDLPLAHLPLLPNSLEQLTFTSCKRIQTIPNIKFERLELLDCSHSSRLEELPDISSVLYLHIYGCTGLKKIGKKRAVLNSVYCWNCPLLIANFSQKVTTSGSPYINIQKSLETRIVKFQRKIRDVFFRRKVALRCCLKLIPFDIKEYLMKFV